MSIKNQLSSQEGEVVLKFGGGVHSRASEDDIDPKECASGFNFDLDPQNFNFRNRKPFDKIGTLPNASRVNGFVTLLKADGTASMLVQGGDTVYEWDGASNFTSRGTVSASARLRGRLQHNWQLSNKVLITDLALVQVVMEWDGTTFQAVTFTDETGGAFGTFRARYCTVQNERAIFANVYSNGTATPHLIVGCKASDYTNITVVNKASSALSGSDPWYVIQPDLRYINGFVAAYGIMVSSSMKGDLFQLTGTTAQDFAISPLYPMSGVSGDESLVYVGNDMFYGRDGTLKSVSDTNRFGDVQTDDLSLGIIDQIENFGNWTAVYNSRLQRVYFIPSNQSQIWVLYKNILKSYRSSWTNLLGWSEVGTTRSSLSAWSKWTTYHPNAFNPTAIMNCYDPSDGLEYVFFGDSIGNVYRMEGIGSSGDGGNYAITTERLSNLIKLPIFADAYDIEGTILYRKGQAATVTLNFEYSGMSVFNESVTVTIPAISNTNVYGGCYYGSAYYGTAFSGRFTRQKFTPPGRGDTFQIRATINGITDFEINEIRIKIKAAA